VNTPTKSIFVLLVISVSLATGCGTSGNKVVATLNHEAELSQLPSNPLGWRIITSSIDSMRGSMSTLYGNDAAVNFARTHAQRDYPAGSILALVTWKQAEDARWFGAKIPGQVQSVEFITIAAAQNGASQPAYESYTGAPLTKVSADPAVSSERIAFILSRRAAVLP
jgi:hypothetical protein